MPRRLLTLLVVSLLVLTVLWGRLFYLQIVHGEEYRTMSEENRTRLEETLAIRGAIYDRQGNLLAKDMPTYSVKILPEKFDDESIPLLSEILGMPIEEIKAKLDENKLPSWENFTLRTNLEESVAHKIEEQHLSLPGVSVEVVPKRTYPYGSLFSHVIGYVAEISQDELKVLKSEGYAAGDNIGKVGLEQSYEAQLRGEKGKRLVEVNAIGQPLQILYEQESVPGNDLVLTIDLKLQQKASELLKTNEMNGAIICLDPKNGEILAIASTPDYDPNLFVNGISSKEYQDLLEKHAFISKATQDRFPPGSTFKLITTVAALEEKVIDPQTYRVFCPGYMDMGGRRFYCWQTSGHGEQDLIEAIANSCNVFFYNLALAVGPEKIAKWADIFGLDNYTGIDLQEEAKGVIPTPSWKEEMTGEPWYPGDTMNMGIGQGDVLVTPLELALAYSGVANGGEIYKPHLVKEIDSYDGAKIEEIIPQVKASITLSPSTLAYIKEGMIRCAQRGTTQEINLPGIQVAAKTGTAQITADKQDIWIVGYAPVDNPQILVLVMDEYSKLAYGSYLAPLAHDLLETYFSSEVATHE